MDEAKCAPHGLKAAIEVLGIPKETRYNHVCVARRALCGFGGMKLDHFSHSALLLQYIHPSTGEVIDRAMLEYLGDKIKNGEPVRSIEIAKLDPSLLINPPPEHDKRLYETFEWQGYNWTKQQKGDHLQKEYTLQELECLVEKHVETQPAYNLSSYVCHDFQEGLRREVLGLQVPPDSIRTTFFRNFGRPMVGNPIKSSKASAGSASDA